MTESDLRRMLDEVRSAGKRIAWERATINGTALSADISGAVTFAEGSAPALNVSGTLEPITVHDLLYYWPIGVGEGAEEWIRSQIIEGRAGPVRIDANFPAGTLDNDVVPEDSLSVTFPFEAMSVRYLGEMRIRQVRADSDATQAGRRILWW